MSAIERIPAAQFKATCLELLDQLAARKISGLEITKRGKVVAVITPPRDGCPFDELYGALQGSVTIPSGLDLTEPAFEGTILAEEGYIDGITERGGGQ
jgi:hypothetical protein